MSEENFFGRPLSKGFNFVEIELCEICQRKTTDWLQVLNEDDKQVFRFVCSDCHQDYLETPTSQDTAGTIREVKDDEKLSDVTRPGWVDEFIQEGKEIGAIENIDTGEQQEQSSAINYSEAPETFSKQDKGEIVPEENDLPKQIAPWAPKFIQEALFGPDPVNWLSEQGGFNENAIPITLQTLESFMGHNVPSVKLSAIQCIHKIVQEYPKQRESIIEILTQYQQDEDETVSEFATQIKNQIQ